MKLPNLFKKSRDVQTKFVLTIAKNIVSYFNMEHIDFDNIMFIRSDIQNHNEELHIYRLPRELILSLNVYYVISVQPTFDLLHEHLMYRKVFHILKHVPKNYKTNPHLLKHDIESFEGEYQFTENFKIDMKIK